MFYSILFQDKEGGEFALCYDEFGKDPFIVKSLDQAKDHLNTLKENLKYYQNLEYKIVKIEYLEE